MDILFSPHGVGGLPKSAMVEMERRTEDLLKSNSFQGMLEPEKKHKMDRLRGPQALLPPSQHPAQLKDGPPPRPERPDSQFPHEQFLMVQATRRTVIPSLSIAIPRAAENERRNRPNEWEAEEDDEYADVGTPTNSEPFQKQVKFLAPEDKDDEEDGMSEQSSICQSPSWEGYGQRKKDKKLEAERRKKEKEQAEKDAKAAKKRNTSRLSKAPPPPPPPPPPATTHRASRALALTVADRSMSDPLLVSRHLLQSTQSIHRPEEVGRTASADNLQHGRWHQSVVTEVVSGSSSSAWCGDTIGDPSATHHSYDNAFAPRQQFRRSMSEGPAPPNQPSAPILSSRHESQSPRDAFPPSASRTPRLRHMSPSGARGNSLLQGAASANQSQESLSATPTPDGTRRNGYVLHQRAQVTERAMAGLADEQLVANIGHHYPPSSSSSGQTQHARRPSLTQEAKSAAMKLVGIKTPSSARDRTDQTDYLTFKAIPYASSVETFTSVGSTPASPRSVDGSFRLHDHERPSTSGPGIPRSMTGLSETSAALERPQTSQGSASLIDPPIAGSGASGHGKKSRNLKDVTKAALGRSKGPQKPVESSKLSVAVPPYFRLRAFMQSRASVYAESKTPPAAMEVAPESTSNPTTAASVSEQAKPTEIGSQGGSRASEGSSSSSAYEDGSPLPSPTTTPDTSRPQSAKDIPLAASAPTKDNSESFGLQDDERTLRQSLDSSKSSTPRIDHSGTRGSFEMGNEDRWSRTALPIDLDCDAQSFMTTVSNFDNVEDMEQESSKSPSSPHAKTEQPEPLKLVSKTNTSTGDAEPAISIPPRSRKRSQSSTNGSPVASSPTKQRQKDQATAQGTTGASEEHGGVAEVRESPKLRASRNYTRPFEQAEEVGKEGVPGRYERKHQPTQRGLRESEVAVELKGQMDALGSPQREWTSSSTSPASSAVPSAGSTPLHALSSDFQIASNPYFANLPEPLKYHGILGELPTPTGPPSPISLPSPLHQVPAKPPAQPRANSAPLPSLASTAAPSRATTPSARTAPVSILKQPKSSASDRPPALSALPKHMQLQLQATSLPVRPLGSETTRMAPIAKMFVECCSCKFYHDMPSKLYECMAKPDAVVEDKLLGISGAITTMVKCPWCHHNMSRACCAGYAAVVYLKEKLH